MTFSFGFRHVSEPPPRQASSLVFTDGFLALFRRGGLILPRPPDSGRMSQASALHASSMSDGRGGLAHLPVQSPLESESGLTADQSVRPERIPQGARHPERLESAHLPACAAAKPSPAAHLTGVTSWRGDACSLPAHTIIHLPPSKDRPGRAWVRWCTVYFAAPRKPAS